MSNKSSPFPLLSVQTVILAATAWGVLALLFFLLFSVPLPGQGRPIWYTVTTYVLENVAFLGAALLCLRNWTSSQIVSGRSVWLAIGLGMASYFVGNLLLGYWELVLQQAPDVSPGDFFFILTYILLGWGMLQAVISRRLNLTPIQWGIVVTIGAIGIVLAYFLYTAPEDLELLPTSAPIEQTAPAETAPGALEAPALEAPETAPAAEPTTAPAWSLALERQLSPYAGLVGLLYTVGDVILVTLATALLLAFWGGRFSLSWRFIAAAAFCFYIADMWFGYALGYIEDYQTGALPEVFWVFSGVLFAIGAALEYDLSNRSRRRTTRRS